jgi:hypothetical protein
MKTFLAVTALLSSPSAFAQPGPEVCRDVARAKVQDQINAYVDLSKQNPNDFGNWRCYEGQTLTLASEKFLYTNYNTGNPIYAYRFHIPCGDHVDQFGFDYEITPDPNDHSGWGFLTPTYGARCLLKGE